MEDVKWLIKKCWIPLLILFLLLVIVIFVRKGLSTKEQEAENVIIVQPFEDGTLRYLSSSVEEKELELSPTTRMEE